MCCRPLSLAGAARFPIPGRGHQQSVMVPLQSPNTVEFVQSLQMWFCFYHFFYFFIKHQYSWQHNNKTPSSDEQSIASDSQAHMQERNMDCKMGIQLLRYFAVHNVKYSINIMHAWIDWAIGTRNNFFFQQLQGQYTLSEYFQ